MEQNEPTETQSEDRAADDVASASSFATVLKGIVNRIYADGDKNFGFVLHGEDEYYFDPRLLASEERPRCGERVFFTPKPPLKRGAKPAAGCVLVFVPALGAYVTPELLGGGKSMMIGNLIQGQFGAARNWPFGAALAFALLAIVLVAMMVYLLRFRRAPSGGH